MMRAKEAGKAKKTKEAEQASFFVFKNIPLTVH